MLFKTARIEDRGAASEETVFAFAVQRVLDLGLTGRPVMHTCNVDQHRLSVGDAFDTLDVYSSAIASSLSGSREPLLASWPFRWPLLLASWSTL